MLCVIGPMQAWTTLFIEVTEKFWMADKISPTKCKNNILVYSDNFDDNVKAKSI